MARRGAHLILTRRERAAMMLAQEGKCGCGCGQKLGLRIIGEHTIPVALGNSGKPDALYREECALAKTRLDIWRIAKMKRQRGDKGQQARRKAGKTKQIRSRGFDKSLRKRFDGSVVPRD